VKRAAAELVVPTPWFPTPVNAMSGAFVADQARLAAGLVRDVEVVHSLEWPGGTPDVVEQLRPFVDRLLPEALLTRPWAGGRLTRVPAMVTGGATVPQRAEEMVASVRTATGGFDSPLVHGHVGYLGGLVGARLAAPGARLVVTEHSTGLGALLEDPQGLDHYAEVLERADKVLCVSGVLRDQLLAALPGYADRVEVLPNPVDFAAVTARPERPEALHRWVFVGGLIERKGVERLVRAFCLVAREDPEVTLTLYGDGPLRAALEALAVEAGVRDRLHLKGVVPHATVMAELPTYDLLLAPSTFETFHLAVPEAVAAGVPVIVSRSGGPQEALAGVEDRVGRFVDVEDSPDQLVEAYRELSGALGTLDLPGAKQDLAARYGPAAVARRLEELYRGSAPQGASPAPAPAPRRAVVLAVSGNRRYAVEPALDVLSAAELVLGARDAALTEVAAERGLEVVAPYLAMRMPPPPGPASLKDRLRGRPAPAAANPFGLRNSADDLVVVTDCHSAQHAASLKDALPEVSIAFDPLPWERQP
jgi:glycosyltransferase involved in cell wall biosynthesis